MAGCRCTAAVYAGVMAWHEGPLAALDLEATGVDPHTAHIVEVGLLRFEADGSSVALVDRLIDPGIPIPAEVTEITGISPTDLAKNGGDPAEILVATRAAIVEFVDAGVPIVIYSAPYDWPLLGAELERHGLGALPDVPPAILIDPLVLDRHIDRYRKGKRTLEVVAAHYGVPLDNAHRAAGDAAATVALARRIAVLHPELHLDGPGIVALQVEAHEVWKTSLNEYLARVNPSRSPVTEAWPTG